MSAESCLHDVADIERSNPIGRVPTLTLGDGEVLIDSSAILDHFDQQLCHTRALVPPNGEPRRRALYLLALSCGTIERAMVANAERRRPQDLQFPDRLRRLQRQTCQGFAALDTELAQNDWFLEHRMTQADITSAVGLTFVQHIFPDLIDPETIPALSRLRTNCEALSAFRAMAID